MPTNPPFPKAKPSICLSVWLFIPNVPGEGLPMPCPRASGGAGLMVATTKLGGACARLNATAAQKTPATDTDRLISPPEVEITGKAHTYYLPRQPESVSFY